MGTLQTLLETEYSHQRMNKLLVVKRALQSPAKLKTMNTKSFVPGFGTVEYTQEELSFLQRELSQKLGKDDLASRPGPSGNTVDYLETWRAIAIANETFGFNGWSSSIVEVKEDYIDQKDSDGRFNVGISVIMRITLKDGTFHEDIGYGDSENQKQKGAAIENAKKKAVSDALKRSLRNFGHKLGLTVYDKEHVKQLKKQAKQRPIQPHQRTTNPHFSQAAAKHTQINTQTTQRESFKQEESVAAEESTTRFFDDQDETDTNYFDEFGDVSFDDIPEVAEPEPVVQSSPPLKSSPPNGSKVVLPPRIVINKPPLPKRPNPSVSNNSHDHLNGPNAKRIKLEHEQ
jgi:DNA repair and recombination protein RAD52